MVSQTRTFQCRLSATAIEENCHEVTNPSSNWSFCFVILLTGASVDCVAFKQPVKNLSTFNGAPKTSGARQVGQVHTEYALVKREELQRLKAQKQTRLLSV